jgi:hypothetical protein
MDTENEKYAIESLLKAKAVTVLMGIYFLDFAADVLKSYVIGAGVSVAAGIPAFRGSGGIYAQKIDDAAIKDLMSINALKVLPYSIVTYQNSNGEDRMLACVKIIAN